MLRTFATAVAWVAAVLLLWMLYRHVLVYTIRGRVVVVTDRALARLLAATGALLALGGASTPWAVASGAVLVLLAAATLVARTWIVVGASPERVAGTAHLVLRGMGFDVADMPASVVGGRGRIRIRVMALSRGALLLRLRTARAINKIALFESNLRKYLVARPRERRATP